MNGLMVPWAQYTLPSSLPLLSMGVMGSRPVTSSTCTRLTWVGYENSKLTNALGNATQKIHPPTSLALTRTRLWPWLWKSPNYPPVNSLVSYTCLPNTNTNPSYIYMFLYYNNLRTTYASKKYNYSDLSLFYNPICLLFLSPSPTPIHYLFGPCQWNKYFHIPAHVPYPVNTF